MGPSSSVSKVVTLASLLGTAALLAACGDSGGGASGSAATTPFDLPTVISLGGPVLSAPRLQPIYFPGHPYQTELDDFLARVAASSYWPAIASEYGVGALTVLPSHTSSIDGPPSIISSSIQALFAQVMSADAAALGPASPDTIYLMLFPATTVVTSSGQALCQSSTASGYHTEATAGGTTVAMVVIPFCTVFAGDTSLTGVAALTPTISHELIEAATDPFPGSAPGFVTTDERHAMWAVALNGGELADMCENETPNLVAPADIGQPVQRIWSNAAATAGRGPCVPVPPGEIYLAAVPTLPAQVAAQRNGKKFFVPGLSAAVGAAATVSVTLRSEGDQQPSWVVGALEFHADNPDIPTDPFPVTGRNRQQISIGVLPNETAVGIFPLILSSKGRGAFHYWIGTVQRHQ